VNPTPFQTLLKRLATTRLTRANALRGLAASAALAGVQLAREPGAAKKKRRNGKTRQVCVCADATTASCRTTTVKASKAKTLARKRCNSKGPCQGVSGCAAGGTAPELTFCVNAADCGTDAEGKMCACRTDATNQRICTRISGRFLATGTCADCQGAEQCTPVVSGGVECVLPCRAS
jgi:hypothetical protein